MKPLIALQLSCIFILCNFFAAGQDIDEAKTKQVFKHHDEAFGRYDLKAVLDDYTEESMIITPDGTYTGLKQIKGFFEDVFKLFPKDSSIEGASLKEVITKDIVYTIWKAKTPKINLDYATETFFIRDGKIIRQTVAWHKVE